MKAPIIDIPSFQNWSCHGCTDCCRGNMLVNVSPEEKARLEKQNWTKESGVDPATMIVSERGIFRLGNKSDGSCVFLDAEGLCRIHARFGEAAKPLACRLFPLSILPVGEKFVVGLRFTCPSAAANRGQPLAARRPQIEKFAREVIPKNFVAGPPVAIIDKPGTDWRDLIRFVKWIDTSMTGDAPVALKLMQTLHWLGAIEKAKLDQIAGAEANEIIEGLVKSAKQKLSALPDIGASRFGRICFRLLVLEYGRKLTVNSARAAGRHRLKMLAASGRFMLGSGRVPVLQPGFAPVKFAAVEAFPGKVPPSADALLTRYFRVHIQSMHFAGRSFHNRPLIEGFRSLALLHPIIIWLARWHALSAGRTALQDEDVARAVTMVDYHHGFSPHLHWHISLLTHGDDISKLCAWYGR